MAERPAAQSAPEPTPEREPASGSPPRVRMDGRRVPALPTLVVPAKKARDALFDALDVNGNGGLSLAEIDKGVVSGVFTKVLSPEGSAGGENFDHKPALMRAYHAADRSKDGFIERSEFALLLQYMVYFNNLWHKFEAIDSDHDRRLDLAEFTAGCQILGLDISAEETEAEFMRCDADGGGMILFGEFCGWCASRHIGSTRLSTEPEPQPEPRMHEWTSSPADVKTARQQRVSSIQNPSQRPVQGVEDDNSVYSAQASESDALNIELSAAEQEEIRHKIYATLLAQASLSEAPTEAATPAEPAAMSLGEMLMAYIDDAEACRLQRSWRAAAESYGQALAIAQRDDVDLAPADVAELHNRRGMVLHQLGNDEGAVAAYTAGIEVAVSSPRATLYCHRGLSRSRMGQLAAAEKDLRRAVELGGETPDDKAAAELAEVARARRLGMQSHIKSTAGASAGPHGRGSLDRVSKRRGANLELPHDITPPADDSSDSPRPALVRPDGQRTPSSKVTPRVRVRVSAQEARTKAQICAATGQSILPAGRGVRLLQEISSIATSYDDVELKALAKAALSEREEATAKWQRELSRLRQQSKRQRQEVEELRKSKNASVAEAAAARRQQDERVDAVRRHCNKMIREARAKQQAAARKHVDEVNLNCQAILATTLASFRQLVTNVTNDVTHAANGTSSPAGTGIVIRHELLSRFDILASEVEAAFSENQQGSMEFSPGQTLSPDCSEYEVSGTLRSNSVSPLANSSGRNSGRTVQEPSATVWHNDSIIGGSQTGLGIYSSDKKPNRPSPSKTKLGPPPPTRTAVLLGLHDGADIPAGRPDVQLTTPVHQVGHHQTATKAPVMLTTAEQEAATKAVAAREAQWAAAAIESFSASLERAPPLATEPKNASTSKMTLEHQFQQFEQAQQQSDAANELEYAAYDEATLEMVQEAEHSRSKPVRPPRRSSTESSTDVSQATEPQMLQREAEAKLLVSDDITFAKQKLRSMSYGLRGQDPGSLLKMYDKDHSGQLSWEEFKAAVRKGGKLPATGAHGLSDVQLRKLFSAVDSDHSGAVSISELTRFVWGNENLLGKHGSTSIGGDAAEHAAPPPDALQMPTHGPLAMPTDTEQEAAFDRMDMNGNGLLSLAEIDKAVVEIWPTFNHKKALMRAYKAADLSGDGYIGRREFPHLLKYLVYFNNLWKQFDIIDSDHNGRLDVKEMHEASQMLGLDLSWTTTVEEFGQMDADGGGYVRFDEFCAWCARHMHGTIVADETTQDPDESEVAAVEDGDSVFSDVNEDEGAGGGDGEEDADDHVLRVTCPDGVGPGEVVRCAWHSFVCMVALPEYREPPGCAAAGCD